MIQDIQKIRTLRSEGKRKWGKDLISFINPYLDENRTYREIIEMLKEKHDFEISLTSITNLKCKFYKSKISINNTTSITSSSEPSQSKIEIDKVEQKQEVLKNSLSILDDANIAERVKRDREALIIKNSGGNKKW